MQKQLLEIMWRFRYEWTYPIAALKVEPAYPKFAEKLGHRDLLGSVMKMCIRDRMNADHQKLDDATMELIRQEIGCVITKYVVCLLYTSRCV